MMSSMFVLDWCIRSSWVKEFYVCSGCFYVILYAHSGMKMSDRRSDQHISIKFCVKLQKTPIHMLHLVCSEDSVKKSSVFKWHKRFLKAQKDIKDVEKVVYQRYTALMIKYAANDK